MNPPGFNDPRASLDQLNDAEINEALCLPPPGGIVGGPGGIVGGPFDLDRLDPAEVDAAFALDPRAPGGIVGGPGIGPDVAGMMAPGPADMMAPGMMAPGMMDSGIGGMMAPGPADMMAPGMMDSGIGGMMARGPADMIGPGPADIIGPGPADMIPFGIGPGPRGPADMIPLGIGPGPLPKSGRPQGRPTTIPGAIRLDLGIGQQEPVTDKQGMYFAGPPGDPAHLGYPSDEGGYPLGDSSIIMSGGPAWRSRDRGAADAFLCTICNEHFPVRRDLLQHRREVHNLGI